MSLASDIEDIHATACAKGEHSYVDPTTGLLVFSALSHKARGKCCGSRCRHCPFQHINVPPERRAQLRSATTGALLYEATASTDSDEGKASETMADPPAVGTEESEQGISREGGGLKVYTRTGDSGTSQLFTGERRGKDESVFDAMGTVDELSAFVGQAREECLQQGCDDLACELETILASLLDVGSAIATPLDGARAKGATWAAKRARTSFDREGVAAVSTLEDWIDALSKDLPPLGSFILPSGGRAATALHICRTVCRRAERVSSGLLKRDGPVIDTQVCVYLNRLSDYFFTAARWAAHDAGADEVCYARRLRDKTRRGLTKRAPFEPNSGAGPLPQEDEAKIQGTQSTTEDPPRAYTLFAALVLGVALGVVASKAAK